MASERLIKPVKMPDDNISTAEHISEVIEQLPDLSPVVLGELYEKINRAVTLGYITLTTQQTQCLRTLSQKFIPDSPKQLNVNAKVQSESIIVEWLNTNNKAGEEAEQKAMEHLSPPPALPLAEVLLNEKD